MAHSRRYLAWALGVIFAANFVNYMDRYLVSGLEAEIEGAFGIKGARFGLLVTAFTIGYMIFSPVVGYLSDHWKRTRLFAACIAIWSAATVICGLTRSFEVLLFARGLIGVGEAGCLIIGPTLVADTFSERSRGKALSLFYLGMPLGGTAGFLVAGLAKDVFHDWNSSFYIAGLPGFVIAALILLLREPRRGGETETAHVPPAGVRWKDYADLLRTRTLIWIILAQVAASFTLGALTHFAIRYFEDFRGLRKIQATNMIGGLALVGGAAGVMVAGWLGDRLYRRTRSAFSLLAAAGYFIGIPALLAGLNLAVPLPVVLPCLAAAFFGLFLCMPAVNTQIANVTDPRERSMAYAAAIFLAHLLGDTISPPIFGWFSGRMGWLAAFQLLPLVLMPAVIFSLLAARSAPGDTRSGR